MAATLFIEELEQWQLLVAVCPIFSLDLAWTSQGSDRRDFVVVEESADLFKANVRAIKVLVAGDTLFLSQKTCDDFVARINALLSTLESLVKDAIPRDFNTTESHQLSSTERRFPKLKALGILMRNPASPISDHTQYLRLVQDATDFKATQYEVEKFNIAMSIYKGGKVAATESIKRVSADQSRSLTLESFRTVSRKVFDSLSTHVKNCPTDSEHKAMLHLNHVRDMQNDDLSPELSLLLSLCSDEEIWHHTQCTVLSQRPNPGEAGDFNCPSFTHSTTTEYLPSTDCEPPITNICHHAQIAHGNQEIFKIQLRGESFWDMSDMIQPINPEAKPTISLHHLLVNGMLRDRYRFFPNDKKILAYILARALAYLHEGPWLQNLWSLNKIFFMYEESTGKVYNIHQPYIPCILSPEPPSLGALDSLHPYPLILAFAKLLLELETGEEVKSTKKSSRDGLPSLMITLRHYCFSSSKHHLSVGYGKALEACVNFPKHLKQGQLDNTDTTVQDMIFKHIVCQLEKEVDLDRVHEWGFQNLDLGTRTPVAINLAAERSSGGLTATNLPSSAQRSPTSTRPTLREVQSSRPQVQSPRAVFGKGSPASDRPRPHTTSKSRNAPRANGQKTKILPSERDLLPSSKCELQSANQLSGQRSSSLSEVCEEARSASSGPHHLTRLHGPRHLYTRLDSSASLPLPEQKARNKTARRDFATIERPASVPNDAQPGMQKASGKLPGTQLQGNPRNNVLTHYKESESNVDSGFGYTQILSASETNISSMSFDNLNDMVNKYWQHVEGTERIGIAILDTGIDLHHEDFKRPRTKTFTGEFGNIPLPVEGEPSQLCRIKSWHNFCPDQGENDVNDLDGHGTQIAGIILRLAPNVDLHIARICAGDINRGVPHDKVKAVEAKQFHKPQPQTIEMAVKWAIEKGVSFINLSCGFRNCLSSDVKGIKAALQKAQSHNIVVFAATSNEGVHKPVAWPAKDHEYAIGIHSCNDGGGRPSEFTAEPYTGVNFMVVGERILSQWPTDKGGGFRLATGSSFATPVATAIGALVLEYVNQKLCSREKRARESRVSIAEIRTKAGMIKVLKAISTQIHVGSWEYHSINTMLFWKGFLEGQDGRIHAWNIIEGALRM